MSVPTLTKIRVSTTAQTQQSPTAPVLQVKNNAGGMVFELSPEKQLDRFLILGVSGGSYYQGETALTAQNAEPIKTLIQTNGAYVVNKVIEVSDNGRARNNDYALYVLAMCFTYGNAETKALARQALLQVARIGTHILHFTNFVNQMRGWGSSLKKAVASWYNGKSAEDVAYQALKYPSRDGWSQRDVLRLAHPKAKSADLQDVYKYIVKGNSLNQVGAKVPPIVVGYQLAKTADPVKLVKLIEEFNLPREMLPTEALNDVNVWAALLKAMGATAMLRNLNKMTSIGLLTGSSFATRFVVEKLTDGAWIRRSRLHPLQILVASKIYSAGRGDKGSLFWAPVAAVVDALEKAFYLSFSAIVPSNKKRFLALDVSGSMNSPISGAPQVSCREAAAVLAMVSLREESNSIIYGFDRDFRDLGITAEDTLPEVCAKTYSRTFATTDCSAPIVHATKLGWDIDQFEIYTDNETYYGGIHPFEAMNQYRSKSGKHGSKLAVVAMTASKFSIANPKDPNMIDLVGFDTATPGILSDFAAGYL